MLRTFIILFSGFEHAWEADHLLAVNNLVTNRNNIKHSMRDGIFWGLGDSTTILLVGILIFFLKLSINEQIFSYFEAGVGLMLILMGVWRLYQYFNKRKSENKTHHHSTSFLVGLVHGLAGSGALVAVVLGETKTITEGIIYLLLFSFGATMGMFLASGIFSVPFSKRLLGTGKLQVILIWISSLLCIGYGVKIIVENLVLI